MLLNSSFSFTLWKIVLPHFSFSLLFKLLSPGNSKDGHWIFRLHFKIDSKLFSSASGQEENREKNVVRHEPESVSKKNCFFCCCMGAKIILISIWSVFAFLKSQRNWNQSVVSCWKPNWVLLKAAENHLFTEIQNRGWGSFLLPFVLIGNVTWQMSLAGS